MKFAKVQFKLILIENAETEQNYHEMYEQKIKHQLSKNDNPKESAINKKHKSDQQYLDTLNPLIMRNFYIILDATKTSKISDFKPSRLSVALKYLATFIGQFLELNPLSQIGIGVAYQHECRHVLDFTSSAVNIEQYLNTIKASNEGGFSFASCLQTSLDIFSQTQLHAVPIILLISSSPYSDDKLEVTEWIEKCKNTAIQVNVISFCGVIQMLQKLSISTKGQYMSPLNENDFQSQLQSFVISNKVDQNHKIDQLVKLGFPIKMIAQQPTLCQCHLNIVYSYYKCPRCYSKVCNPPLMCPVCAIWIVLPHQILRNECQKSLSVFQTIFDGELIQCQGCELQVDIHSICPQCSKTFCFDCDILIHSSLKVCPGCC